MKIDTSKVKSLSEFIPYRSQVDLNTIKTADSSYLRVIKVQGVSHETADDLDINLWSEQLNNLLKNIANTRVAIWSHIVRRRTSLFPRGEFKNPLADEFNQKYKEHITKNDFFVNELYFTIVYRDVEEGYVAGFSDIAKNIINKKNKEDLIFEQRNAINNLDKITDDVLSGLDDYNPVMLGCYTLKEKSKLVDGIRSKWFAENQLKSMSEYKKEDGEIYSEPLEFLSFLLNGFNTRVKLPKGESHHYLPESEIFWNEDKTFIKNNQGNIFGANIGVVAYQDDETNPVMLEEILDLPFEFVLSQSFTFVQRRTAMKNIKDVFNRMVATDDVGHSQKQALLDAMDDLQSQKFEMGNYSFSMFVKSPKAKYLSENISDVLSIMVNSGLKGVVENIANQASYFSMLPANFKFRPRVSMVSSLNFCDYAPLHNYPIGKYSGNQWGEALTIFKTSSDSPYFFNFHSDHISADSSINDDLENEIVTEKEIEKFEYDLANTIVCGESGAGKTVLQQFLLAQSFKYDTDENPALFIATDSERGMSIGIKALGGRFFDISAKSDELGESKKQTFNPFLLPNTTENVIFLVDFVKQLVESEDFKITPSDEKLLTESIQNVLNQKEDKFKRLSNIRRLLNIVETDGIYDRLEKWCGDGIYAWVFDNEYDNFDLEETNLLGFEMSSFLNNEELRPAISMYFFHRVEQAMDGRRVIIFLDEFWQVLQDEYFSAQIEGLLRRIRKRNGFLVMFTQSPNDFIKSSISDVLLTQCSTQILLPNTKGNKAQYTECLKLSDAEWEILKSLGKKSRKFIIRQGGGSVLAELDLKGFDKYLAVFSATATTMNVVDKLEIKYGQNPEKWLPKFYDYLDGKEVL